MPEEDTQRPTRETPEPGRRSNPPREAVGFTLLENVESTERTCVDAGHAWSPRKDAFICSGTPASVGTLAKARLAFCDHKLCDLTVFVAFEGEDESADDQLKTIVDAMRAKYGQPAKNHKGGTAYCRSQGLVRCTANGGGALTQSWEWTTGEKILLSLRGNEGKAILAVRYLVQPPNEGGASAF